DHDPLLAHSRNDAGVAHTLDDHLRGTAELARRFAEPLGIPDLAYWVGLWHDLGKASCTFQSYLAACSVDPAEARRKHPHREHKTTGAYHAHRTLTGIPAAAAALTILGHHGGIPAGAALRDV